MLVERGEGLGQDAVKLFVSADLDPLEDGLVHQPADMIWGAKVGARRIGDDRQGQVERSFDVFELDRQAVDDRLGLLAFAPDAYLFLVVEAARHPVLVMRSQQLAFLLVELAEDAVASRQLALADRCHLGESRANDTADAIGLLGCEHDGGVVALDGFIDAIDAVVALAALLALAKRADEVGVGAAVAGVLGVRQPMAAGAAVQRALQVVRVVTVALSAEAVGA